MTYDQNKDKSRSTPGTGAGNNTGSKTGFDKSTNTDKNRSTGQTGTQTNKDKDSYK